MKPTRPPSAPKTDWTDISTWYDGLVGDVELGVGEGEGRVRPEQLGEVVAELAGAARDQRPHRTAGKESSAGRTSQRSSSQRML